MAFFGNWELVQEGSVPAANQSDFIREEKPGSGLENWCKSQRETEKRIVVS